MAVIKPFKGIRPPKSMVEEERKWLPDHTMY